MSNTYLIEILKPIAYMPTELYIQEATLSHDKKKFYAKRGSRGIVTISVKSARIIKQIQDEKR